VQALEHDGDNARDNWRAHLHLALPQERKRRKDHQARAKRDRIAVGGRQRKGPPMAGTRASGIRRRMDGTVERR
jgi:hypothetical protein